MRKKKTTNRTVQSQKQKYLKVYLLQRVYTLKDLKCEVILVLCDMLIDNFKKSEEEGDNELLLDNITLSDRGLISDTLNQLQEDIHNNILTIDKVQNIIDKQHDNQDSLIQSRLVSGLYYFYNMGADTLKSSIIRRSETEENIKWMPCLLTFSLIQYMIENNYIFNKFTFVNKYDLDKIFSIYNKTNILIKKRDNISFLSKEKTIIDNMMDTSNEVVDKLIKSKYK